MALLKYFQLKITCKPPLPNHNRELSLKIPLSEISSANACIGKLLNSIPGSDDAYSRGPYTNLSPAQKFEIGKKAAEIATTCSPSPSFLMATAKLS